MNVTSAKGFVFFLALALSVQGCRKSPKNESREETAAKQHEHERIVRTLNEEIMRQPATVVTFASLDFLKKAKKVGQLPGAPKDERGMFRAEKRPQFGNGTYYSTIEIHYFTINGPRRNCYFVVSQAASNSTPKLEKAWSVDQTGAIHQEYPIQ